MSDAMEVLTWLSERRLTAKVRKPGDVCTCCQQRLQEDRYMVELWHGNALVGGGSAGDLPRAYAAAQMEFDQRVKRLLEGLGT